MTEAQGLPVIDRILIVVPEWTVEIEVRGNQVIKHVIDGQVVLQYEKPQLDDRDEHARELSKGNGGLMLDAGTISLQSESHPIDFRKVEILVLSAQ